MKRLPGQALRGCRRVLHIAAELTIALAVLAGVGLAVLGWRLSQGPLDIGWLARRIEETVNASGGPTRFAIGSAGLAWEGFSGGSDRPVDIRLRNITITQPSGQRLLDVPSAEVSLSFGALLLGRLVPRAVEVDGLRLALKRAADGSIGFDLGSLGDGVEADAASGSGPDPLGAMLAELARPPQNDTVTTRRSWLRQLSRLRLRDLQASVADSQLGATWTVPHAEVDLRRGREGGVEGDARASLALHGRQVHLSAVVSLAAGGTGSRVRFSFTPVSPVTLAAVAPRLAPLAAFDAPVSGRGDVAFARGLALRHARLDLIAGTGSLHLGGASVAFERASAALEADPARLRLDMAQIVLAGGPVSGPSTLTASGEVRRAAGRFDASVQLGLDHFALADIGRVWPAGMGGNARDWLLENVTAGEVRDGKVNVEIAASADFSEVAVTRLNGSLEGTGLTVHWLAPVPPITQGSVHLTIVDPDEIDLTIASGELGKLRVSDGTIRFTGLAAPDQVARIDGHVSGPVVDALALLREPRLKLLSAHPIDLRDPAGEVSVKLSVTLPLEKNVTMDDVPVSVEGRLTGVHLGGVVAGRDLDRGDVTLKASQDGMSIAGTAAIGGVPAKISAEMDFRAGPPSQVLERISATARADGPMLARAGLALPEALTGTVGLQAGVTMRRDGRGEVTVKADLKDVAAALRPLAWSKEAGTPGSASLAMRLDHDRIAGIDSLDISASGLSLQASGSFPPRGERVLQLHRLVAGRSEAQGRLYLPAPGAPLRLVLDGPLADLSSPAGEVHRERSPAEEKPGSPFAVEARFARVLVGRGVALLNVAGDLETDGVIFRRARLSGATGPDAPFSLSITPAAAGTRRLEATARDAGALLAAFDIIPSMRGGALSLEGVFDDRAAGHPLTGTARIDDFRIVEAPALARLLQAMTLYGLVDTMRGPGLGFSHLVAPFRLTRTALDLNDARAFNSSLGLTAKGQLDLAGDKLDMEGTIVPAYFFNSLLGNVPLVGRLFSPERGGGLFAASYTLRGPMDDPSVSVNPLSALTPGFLRGLFGIFDNKKPAP